MTADAMRSQSLRAVDEGPLVYVAEQKKSLLQPADVGSDQFGARFVWHLGSQDPVVPEVYSGIENLGCGFQCQT